MELFYFMSQGEESRGYKELAGAAGKVNSVPVAICTVKEVWTDYGISSDTITLFRKVLYTIMTAHGFIHMRYLFNNKWDGCCQSCDDDRD